MIKTARLMSSFILALLFLAGAALSQTDPGVQSGNRGTGAALSIVPAQNATGNWIKVVQRLPVRIALDPKELAANPLRVGLSMNADINVSR